MRTLVESLRRLYAKDKITLEKLQELLNEDTINQKEYDYIISVKKKLNG